jgi:aerobic-type carbon monoxide dehydrogenase small subunit (CoxS/CutS family)
MPRYALTVNGKRRVVDAPEKTPLLYVLRNDLELDGPQFGCGMAQCGACSVLVGKKQVRSCVTPVAAVTEAPITTLEGMPALWAQETGKPAGPNTLHPLQQAWIDDQIPQCGYCQNGMIVEAAALLYRNPAPTDAQIKVAMDGHLCRCGTYGRIVDGVKQAAKTMATQRKGGNNA